MESSRAYAPPVTSASTSTAAIRTIGHVLRFFALGAATGFVGAFLGQLITYGFSATTLLWVLPAVARGLVFGLLFKAFKGSLKPYILCIETVISALVVTAINSIVMYIDSIVYSYTSVILGIALVNRIIAAVITSVIFALVLPPILKALKKIIKI